MYINKKNYASPQKLYIYMFFIYKDYIVVVVVDDDDDDDDDLFL